VPTVLATKSYSQRVESEDCCNLPTTQFLDLMAQASRSTSRIVAFSGLYGKGKRPPDKQKKATETVIQQAREIHDPIEHLSKIADATAAIRSIQRQ